ncbi:MAG: transglutaminase-like domain-containing protein, partial [Planctomycetota bacterium]
RLAFALILLVTANCGWIASSILYRHVEVLNYLPVWFWRGTNNLDSNTGGQFHVGFSTSGELSSVMMIKGDQDPTPMLSIKCDRSPGYLRARAFETYLDSKWLDRSYEEPVQPDNGPFGMYIVGRRNLFRLDNKDTSNCSYMTIRHESELADALFTPLGTVTLNAPLPLLLHADDGIVRTRNLRVGLNYEIAYPRSTYRKPPTSVQVRQMLDMPKRLESDIRQLANRIFAGRTTTTEKIDAVVRHFRTNYTYFLGVDAPFDRDKLAYFLLEESVGYCEYFASGAAILLRMAGVPTRYVTGFVVTEKHPDGELWVARNMDAHAWVEAWDKERNQWTIVEATSEQDLGMISAAEQLEKLRGGSGTFWGQLLQAIARPGPVPPLQENEARHPGTIRRGGKSAARAPAQVADEDGPQGQGRRAPPGFRRDIARLLRPAAPARRRRRPLGRHFRLVPRIRKPALLQSHQLRTPAPAQPTNPSPPRFAISSEATQ